MTRLTPVRLMLLGAAMMLFAAASTFLMALRWIPSTFWLNFLASIASVVGLTIGLYGLFQRTHPRRRNTRRSTSQHDDADLREGSR